MKRITRLTESDLHRIVKESVKRVLREGFTKPSNWKDTEFKGTYTDENGALYMPDDDFDNETTNEDIPRSVRKDQMNADFENNRTPKPYNSKYYYDDFNMNTYDFNGDLGMKALKGDKFAKTLRRNTPQGWVDAAKDSKID